MYLKIKLGWSITRYVQHDPSVPPAVTCDHAHFPSNEAADRFEDQLRMAHDQDRYDVRTWRADLFPEHKEQP